MEGHEDWRGDAAPAGASVDAADATAGADEPVVLRRPKPAGGRASAANPNRRSVVIAALDGTAPGTVVNEAAHDNRHSRLFPDIELQPMLVKERMTMREPAEAIYVDVPRWPWVLLAITLLAGSIVMLVFGGLCIQAYYVDAVAGLPDTSQSVCGPAGGGGGIVMLIAGIVVFCAAVLQLVRLRTPSKKFVGYKNATTPRAAGTSAKSSAGNSSVAIAMPPPSQPAPARPAPRISAVSTAPPPAAATSPSGSPPLGGAGSGVKMAPAVPPPRAPKPAGLGGAPPA